MIRCSYTGCGFCSTPDLIDESDLEAELAVLDDMDFDDIGESTPNYLSSEALFVFTRDAYVVVLIHVCFQRLHCLCNLRLVFSLRLQHRCLPPQLQSQNRQMSTGYRFSIIKLRKGNTFTFSARTVNITIVTTLMASLAPLNKKFKTKVGSKILKKRKALWCWELRFLSFSLRVAATNRGMFVVIRVVTSPRSFRHNKYTGILARKLPFGCCCSFCV